MGECQLLGHGRQPPNLGESHQHPRRQVGALGLDAEAAGAEHVVKSDAVVAGKTGEVVHQVAHRRERRASSSPSAFRGRADVAHGALGNQALNRVVSLSIQFLP